MVQDTLVQNKLNTYKEELTIELNQILNYWIKNTIDNAHGGFYGQIDNDNHILSLSAKGSVLNARILWSFSAAYNLSPNKEYLNTATRAYQYIVDHFVDKEYGGVFWSVDYNGNALDSKKQVYAIAFTIYALCEYFIATEINNAKDLAIDLYHILLEKSYDPVNTGYFEAFSRGWGTLDDLRLSKKDANEKKTMNTHLHVLEAYTNLYRIWPDENLKLQLETLLNNFFDHIINSETNHLILFFDENWNPKSDTISYGHDIEATWLLLEASHVVKNSELIKKAETIAVSIAETTLLGLDDDGGLWYEYEPAQNHLIKEKHWWVQAEAMVGFYNAWQLSNNARYLNTSLQNWTFIKNKILDTQHGEWFWGVNIDGQIMRSEDKVGIWKCPYHNSRACMEIIRRLN